MWLNFNEDARKTVFYAQDEAGRFDQSVVGTEHLLLGMMRMPESDGTLTLIRLGVDLEALRAELEAQATQGSGQGRDFELSPSAKRVIDLAYEESQRLNSGEVGTEHLLLGLVQQGLAGRVLTKFGLTLEAIQGQFLQMQGDGTKKPAGAAPDELLKDELLNLDEAVKFLGTSKPTLYRLLGQDAIKGLKVGRQWRFRKADLIAYMERSPVAVAAAPALDLDGELGFFAGQLQQVGELLTEPLDEEANPGERKTIQLAQSILKLAIAMLASDIHLEPARDGGVNFLRLRYRVDGLLHEIRRLPDSVREALTARFKIMADMNVNEKRTPQDGRIPVRHKDKDFDLRVSVVPSIFGEVMAVRILLKDNVLLGLDNLGLSSGALARIRELLRLPNGILIAAGPAGSGKTTLMYSVLQDIAGLDKNIITAEDPVEAHLPLTSQVQVNARAGLTFAGVLRPFLRQDPDVIFVGELRDEETARVITEASLTGHLVLSTLYANDAPAALARLLDLGLEPYLISATVIGVVAQRLCRKICDNCKQSYQAPARDLTRFGLEPDDLDQTITLYRGDGCEKCRFKGYRGRTGLFELLIMNEEIANLVVSRAPQAEVAAAARAAGMNSLWQDGLLKVLDGVTAPDEVMRVCSL